MKPSVQKKHHILWGLCALILLLSCGYELPYRPQQFIEPRLSVPLTSRDMIRDFLKIDHYNFKFAFTRKADQSIYVVDFSQVETTDTAVIPKAYRLKTDGMPDSPLLSPDGSMVTYFLRLSSSQQKAYVWKIGDASVPIEIASQGTDPHFWQDSTGRLFVVYSDKFQVNKNELPAIEGFATYLQEINPAGGTLIGSRKVLVNKPFNGGRSKNGKYLCTGYSDGAIYNMENETLYRVNYIGSNAIQICNPSISSDTLHQDWMLFLNFAGTQGLDYAPGIDPLGSTGEHEYLIIADTSNQVQWYAKQPSEHYEWQDPEWSNNGNFITALAKISNSIKDLTYDCYLIRRSDKALLKVTGSAFKMDGSATPSLWIGNN
jgi:hypothetical protein